MGDDRSNRSNVNGERFVEWQSSLTRGLNFDDILQYA